jgi:hypothetical protein
MNYFHKVSTLKVYYIGKTLKWVILYSPVFKDSLEIYILTLIQ